MVVDYPGRWVRIRRCDDPRVAEDARYREVVDELLADAAVTEAKMMGMPSLKVGDKMFGGLFDGELVVKVGRNRVEELVAADRASPFDPSGRGRPMKDWAMIPESEGDWLALAEEAKAFAADA